MFYSQTFLARKGALSTVWIAAHLQNRLKKSQYTSTDIPKTVKHIMDPEVPIALRMSAFLLLGVVRIYSKKVDYLLNDCNAIRIGLYKVFAAVSNNTLPEDARQAPVHTITMPNTFELDALDLGNEIDINGYDDPHTRSQEEITLADRIPVVMDNYVTICFDEDITFGSSDAQQPPDSEARPMEEDIIPNSPPTNVADVQDGGPSFHEEPHNTDHTSDDLLHRFQDQDVGPSFHGEPHNTDHTSDDILHRFQDQDGSPSFQRVSHDIDHTSDNLLHRFQDPNTNQALPMEGLRDASVAYDTIGNLQEIGFNNDTEPNMNLDQNMNEKDPILEMIDEINVEPSPTQQARPPTPVAAPDGPSDAQVSGGQVSPPTLGHGSFDFRVIPSPQIEQEQGQNREPQRGRKRKQFFDNPIVLTNKDMKNALNNTDQILRKRKEAPSSSFDTQKLKIRRLKENIFEEPLFPGIPEKLIKIQKKEYICSKSHLVISEEDHPNSTTDTLPINQVDESIVDAPEIIVDASGVEDTTTTTTVPINQVADESLADAPETIVNASDVEDIEHIRSVPDAPLFTIPTQIIDTEPIIEGTTYKSPVKGGLASPSSVPETEEIPYVPTSPGAHGYGIETPSTYHDNMSLNYDMSNTNQLNNSAEKEELWFLEIENNTPSSQSTSTSTSISTFSGRTRGLAQYIKDYSPCTPIPEHPAEDFSLNKILDGKTKKIAARMFYEVLVLKSHGLIDVQQEEPYGDVSFNMTSKLSEAKI